MRISRNSIRAWVKLSFLPKVELPGIFYFFKKITSKTLKNKININEINLLLTENPSYNHKKKSFFQGKNIQVQTFLFFRKNRIETKQ